jgi:hypothetical protein
MKEPFDGSCAECGGPFKSVKRAQKYCGDLCRARALDLLTPEAGEKSRHKFVRALSAKLRLAVFARDKFRCAYCGAQSDHSLLHLDHIWSVRFDGESAAGNLVASCSTCSHAKDAHVFNPELCAHLWERTMRRSLNDDTFISEYTRIYKGVVEKLAADGAS